MHKGLLLLLAALPLASMHPSTHAQQPKPPAPAPAPAPKLPKEAFWVESTTSVEVEVQNSKVAVLNKGYITSPPTTRVKLAVPSALTTLASLEKLNPGLSKILPGLARLMPAAQVAPGYGQIYAAKHELVAAANPQDAGRYFDCASVLTLKNPASGAQFMLIQSDMDVDTDGTDAVRFTKAEDYALALTSDYFKPMLSFRWIKSPSVPHPLLAYFPETIQSLLKEKQRLKEAATNPSDPLWKRLVSKKMASVCDQKAKSIQKLLDETKVDKKAKNVRLTNIEDMKNFASPMAEHVPFFVVPSSWVYHEEERPSAPVRMGALGAVIVKGRIYPAMVADAGPLSQFGESSLRLCREINPAADGTSGAVEGPRVTYIIFNGQENVMPRQLPDLDVMRARVAACLEKIGGLGAGIALHQWKPSPAPAPPTVK